VWNVAGRDDDQDETWGKANEPFLSPTLEGSRAAEHRFPVDLLQDFAAYQDLVLEVAKTIYKEQHGKDRAPKGFAQSFELRVRAIGRGSSVAVLDASFAVPEFAQFFWQARDRINAVIQSPSVDALRELPEEAIPFFDRFGKSLLPSEKLVLRRNGLTMGSSPVLTQERRKQLLTRHQGTYEKVLEVGGSMTVVNWQRRRVTIRPDEGPSIEIPFADRDEHRLAVAQKERHFVQLVAKGTATFNARDEFQHFEGNPDLSFASAVAPGVVEAIETRLEKLGRLERGWLDGAGEPIRTEGVRELLARLLARLNLPLPDLLPTESGQVRAEWVTERVDLSAEFDASTRSAYLHALKFDTNESDDLQANWDEDGEQSQIEQFLFRFAPRVRG
jgi:hypothetical protein